MPLHNSPIIYRSKITVSALCFVIALLVNVSQGQQIALTELRDIETRGDLAERIELAVAYLDLATRQQLWSGFEAELTDDHSFGLWAADWPGRTLEAYARTSLALGKPTSKRFDEVGFGLLGNQRRDGAFKNGKPIAPERTGYAYSNGYWFGNARGLLGLIWAHKYRPQQEAYLDGAKKLGDHFVANYFAEGQLGAPSSFWWVGTEAMVELYGITEDRKYLDFGVRIAESVPDVNPISQHTHSYLLAIRGIVNICAHLQADEEASVRRALLAKALKQHEYFENHVMWPGGGIVEHLGQPEGYSLNYWFDEGCSVFDWWGLNVDLWRVTKETRFLDMAERTARNHLLFNQDRSGGFCGDRGIDFVREGSPWPFCCAMHGTRTLAEIPQYIATTDQESIFVSFYYPSTTDLVVQDHPVTIQMECDYLTNGVVELTVESAQELNIPFNIRVPAWSRVAKLSINGEPQEAVVKAGWCVLDRVWKGTTDIRIQFEMTVRTEPMNDFIGLQDGDDTSRKSLWFGPRQLVYNQSINQDLHKIVQDQPALRHVYQTYGELQLDQSTKKTPLTIGEKKYKKGLGTHSVSEITYWLDGQFKDFRSDIGIDASAEGAGAVRFKVCADGKVVHGDVVKASIGEKNEGQVQSLYGFEVTAMSGRDPAKSILVDVTDTKLLTLVVDEAVNGLAKDYANWAEARLIKKDGTVVYLSDLPNDRAKGIPFDQLEIDEENVHSVAKERVVFGVSIGGKDVPVVFSFLDSLGYDLMKNRPVLRSYVKTSDN